MPAPVATIASPMVRRRKQLEETSLRNKVAVRVRQARMKSKKSVSEMAKSLKIPEQTYYGYENGKSEFPLSVLERVAEILGVSMHRLIPKD